MADLKLMGRQVVMLQKQLELAEHQNNEEQQQNILEKMKEMGDRALEEDDRLDRFVVYIVAIKAIYEYYHARQDYVRAGNIAVESLVKMAPLVPYLEQERPATMIAQHLNYATWAVLELERDDIDNGTVSEAQAELTELLAELFAQSVENVRRIRPSSPIVPVLSNLVGKLDDAGITGQTDCILQQMDSYLQRIENLWVQVKPFDPSVLDSLMSDELIQMLAGTNDMNRRLLYSDGSERDAEHIDPVIRALFARLYQAIDYDRLQVYVAENGSDSKGFSFFRTFINFAYAYRLYSQEWGLPPSEFDDFTLDMAMPYCLQATVDNFHQTARRYFLEMRNTYGEFQQILTEQLDNDDAMLNAAEMAGENLQLMIISLVEMNIEAEGLKIDNEELYLRVLGKKDDEVTQMLNLQVEEMRRIGCLPSSFAPYTTDEVTAICDRVTGCS